MSKFVYHKRLPRAALVHVGWSHGKWMLAAFRLANARQFYVGPFVVIFRARWLKRSAEALHPHLFLSPEHLSQVRQPEES